ncbi:MAG: hypothetical protein NE330_18255 [Lentisphaeraceae bacterium]|nr:hypothetical protein [Lentisphaeraceae bacterium]
MNKPKRFSLDDIEEMESQSDQEKFDKTTDEDILEQIKSDLDTRQLTDEELKEMKLVTEKKTRAPI